MILDLDAYARDEAEAYEETDLDRALADADYCNEYREERDDDE